jgi:hypothetical protein
MSKAALKKSPPAVPPVGALVKVPFGTSDVVATVLEDRGPLGVGGRHLVRVKFLLEATEDAVVTEVPVDELTLVALPDDPAEKRIDVEAAGAGWVGTYTAPDGRVAVVTEEASTEEQARRAALRWVRIGLLEKAKRRYARDSETPYVWKPDPRHPGRYVVLRRGRLRDEIAREKG